MHPLVQEAGVQLTCIGHDIFNLILKEMVLRDIAALARVCKSMAAKLAACLSGWIDHCASLYSMKLTILAITNRWILPREHAENVRQCLATIQHVYGKTRQQSSMCE
jgi:hypothetical protein